MAPQVDTAIATNAAFKRNHLEIAGMGASISRQSARQRNILLERCPTVGT
jgi:hypothetical protein